MTLTEDFGLLSNFGAIWPSDRSNASIQEAEAEFYYLPMKYPAPLKGSCIEDLVFTGGTVEKRLDPEIIKHKP